MMMKKIFHSIILGIALSWCAMASGQQLTPDQCQGSLGPYPSMQMQQAAPDSLTPVCLIHVGRHGSRYPAGSYSAKTMLRALNKADSLHTLTPLGLQFKRVIENICVRSLGRWGDLDAIGIDEQRCIAQRTVMRCKPLFTNANVKVKAIASHSPRSVMSMFAFLHSISEKVSGITIESHSNKQYNQLVRPFETDTAYVAYQKKKPYMSIYNAYVDRHAPNTVTRLLGEGYPATERELKELSIIEYYNIANMKAMCMTNDWEPYFTLEEYQALWSCFNLRQYFMHCHNALTSTPADIAKPLLRDIIKNLRAKKPVVIGYFAHQETVMPLMSLLQVPGCTYTGTDYDQLGTYVQDFVLSPMAANVQFTVYKTAGDNYYLRCDVNEQIVPIIAGDNRQYTPLRQALRHLQSLLK